MCVTNYDLVIEKLESLKVPYGDYGTDDERATNEALSIAIDCVKESKREKGNTTEKSEKSDKKDLVFLKANGVILHPALDSIPSRDELERMAMMSILLWGTEGGMDIKDHTMMEVFIYRVNKSEVSLFNEEEIIDFFKKGFRDSYPYQALLKEHLTHKFYY